MQAIADKAHMNQAELLKFKKQQRKELLANEAKKRENEDLKMIKETDDDKHETIEFRERKRDEA